MKIVINAYGIAREILNESQMTVEFEDGISIKKVKEFLTQSYPDFTQVENVRFAVNDEYQEDDFILKNEDELIIIPAVSGG
jgi:molybdopterin converting factor small subunit